MLNPQSPTSERWLALADPANAINTRDAPDTIRDPKVITPGMLMVVPRTCGSSNIRLHLHRPGPSGTVREAPNGTLFGDGVCARIKAELLTEFNLHTIVRLPNGVFAPYTSIPTNILFFDRSGPTREVWYYEQPLPNGRKNYTKTAPVQFEQLAESILDKERRIAEIRDNIKGLLAPTK